MIVQERHTAILGQLRKRPRQSFERLQASLGVSRSTLRRDLLELEHLGEVVRLRGEVVHAEHYRGEPTFDRRRARAVAQKQAIARAAAELVPDNCSVYIDAGTTCLEVGRLLLKRADLRLFTHSIRLVALAGEPESQASVVCVGGEYRRVSDAVVGGLTAGWLDHLRFDVAILAASGLDEDGLTTTELTETQVKQHVIRRSATCLLVADAEKWGHPASVRFAGWDDLHHFITDKDLPGDARKHLKSHPGLVLTIA